MCSSWGEGMMCTLECAVQLTVRLTIALECPRLAVHGLLVCCPCSLAATLRCLPCASMQGQASGRQAAEVCHRACRHQLPGWAAGEALRCAAWRVCQLGCWLLSGGREPTVLAVRKGTEPVCEYPGLCLPLPCRRSAPTCALPGPPTSGAAVPTASARFCFSMRRARSPSPWRSCRCSWGAGLGWLVLGAIGAAGLGWFVLGAVGAAGWGGGCSAWWGILPQSLPTLAFNGSGMPAPLHKIAPLHPPCAQAAAAASCEAAAAAAAAAGAVGGSGGSGAAEMIGSGDLGGSLMSASLASEAAPERGASMALDGVTETEGAEMEAEVCS